MAIVAAAIVPHNPLLLPNINKHNSDILAVTHAAFESYADELHRKGIDTVVIISSQTPRLPKTFGVNFALELEADFKSYGDLATTVAFKTDISLAHHLKEYGESKIPIHSFTESSLDYGTAVPLMVCSLETKPFKVVQLSLSRASCADHLHAGAVLQEKLDTSSKRVAVFVSTHLSHVKDASVESSAEPTTADAQILKLLKQKNSDALCALDSTLLETESVFGMEAIALLFGMLQEKKYEFIIRSYERVLGTGHLLATAQW